MSTKNISARFAEFNTNPKFLEIKAERMALLHTLPKLPGIYEDEEGDFWELTAENIWIDEKGEYADPEFNWMLANHTFTASK
jgi:hypothetical protein